MNNEEKILSMLEAMHGQMAQMYTRLDNMDSRLNNMDSRLDNMDSRLDNMDSRMDIMQRQLDAVQETVTRTAVTQENVVLPRLQILLEGHIGLAETRASNERVAALEEDMAVIRPVIENLSTEVAKLKAAK